VPRLEGCAYIRRHLLKIVVPSALVEAASSAAGIARLFHVPAAAADFPDLWATGRNMLLAR
jgi:hypothetical protein